LSQTLEEEKETDEKLTSLAGEINSQALQGQEEQSPSKEKSKAKSA
jgi:ferritin-like metal-binding protein YciE